MDEEYLFVYGTLRNDYHPKLIDLTDRGLEFIGEGRVRASLYDMGNYPAAVKENENDELIGDVYLVNDPESLFELLDEYEGEEYKRKEEQVQIHSGETITAWMYWYTGQLNEAQKINESDYLKYLKNKLSSSKDTNNR